MVSGLRGKAVEVGQESEQGGFCLDGLNAESRISDLAGGLRWMPTSAPKSWRLCSSYVAEWWSASDLRKR